MHQNKPLVTILIPHYRTLELTKLCLRLIKLHTDLDQVRVIVIDNGSKDASSEYLKTVAWVEVLTREPHPSETPPIAHSLALDQALAMTTTPYVLSIHTDTLVYSPKWLPFLLSHLEGQDQVAGVGSWKLEMKPWYKLWAKHIERFFQKRWSQRVRDESHYLRSHCALYRTDLLKQNHLSFAGNQEAAGKAIHEYLIRKGYEMKFLPSEVLSRYLHHINHATMFLNPELGARNKTQRRGHRRLARFFKLLGAADILKDDALDR